MKKVHYIVVFMVMVSTILASCKEDLTTYTSKNSVYFTWTATGMLSVATTTIRSVITDSLDLNFALTRKNLTDSIVKIPIAITGTPADVDRSVKVMVNPSSTAILGQHFSFEKETVIHKGQMFDTVYLRVKRTPDLVTTRLKIDLLLQANEHFETNFKNGDNPPEKIKISYTKMRVGISDILSRPPRWGADTGVWGIFTEKKLYLISQVTGEPISIFSQEASTELTEKLDFMRVIFVRYLAEQKAKGQTVYEDNGAEMIVRY